MNEAECFLKIPKLMTLFLTPGNSRPTTPTESENSGSIDSLAMSSSDGVQNGVESNSSYNSLPLQTDIDNVLASMGHVLPLGSTNASSNAKTDGGVVKKKNKRSKHTKSCEIDAEDLEKAFAIAAANAIVPAGSKVDQLSVNSGSTKKKGHRRVKSGSGAKVDLDPGEDKGR